MKIIKSIINTVKTALNKNKALALLFVIGFISSASFAEGTPVSFDASYGQQLSTAFTNWVTAIMPSLLAVLGAAFGVSLLFTLVRWIRRAGK